MKRLLKYFKFIKWYEYLCISLLLCAVLALGIVFDSDALVICNSIFGILAIFLIGKGYILGNIFEILAMVFYCFVAFSNRYYGEIVINGILAVAYAINLFFWMRNKYRNSGIVKINREFNWKEFSVVATLFLGAGVGIYFMLSAFNTANLIFSTISVVLGLFTVYCMIQRSILNYIFGMLSDVICICLWAMVVADGSLNYLPTLVNYVIFVVLNFFGMLNWFKLMKSQMRKPRKRKTKRKKLKDTEKDGVEKRQEKGE